VEDILFVTLKLGCEVAQEMMGVKVLGTHISSSIPQTYSGSLVRNMLFVTLRLIARVYASMLP
jgi:hypothetical protein